MPRFAMIARNAASSLALHGTATRTDGPTSSRSPAAEQPVAPASAAVVAPSAAPRNLRLVTSVIGIRLSGKGFRDSVLEPDGPLGVVGEQQQGDGVQLGCVHGLEQVRP